MGLDARILTMDREQVRTAIHQAMQYEYFLEPGTRDGKTIQMDATIRAQLLANRDKFIDDVYDAAIIMYNAINGTGNSLFANAMTGVVDPNDPTQYIVTAPCYGSQNIWNKYYSNIKVDHPEDVASDIGTKYNWANDSGTQFTRWEDEDACNEDLNITGEDGYLYDSNTVGSITSSKAHSDIYGYTYTKGYCTGHPKPEIVYYECDHDEDDDCDCEEKNAELDRIAEEAWQQVDYCDKLSQEGGFFHTATESITDEAKNELEADRDQFYKDFISLTYDYSAEETGARAGYILHGDHTDDIPIERVTIHSSEYLDEIAKGNTPSSSGDSDDEAEGASLDLAVQSVEETELASPSNVVSISNHDTDLVRASLNIPETETEEATAEETKGTEKEKPSDEEPETTEAPEEPVPESTPAVAEDVDDEDEEGSPEGRGHARDDAEPPKTEGVMYSCELEEWLCSMIA